jgi:TP901 family phage tail tape measure protein
MAVQLNFQLAGGAQSAVQQFMDNLQGAQKEVFRLSDAIRNFDENGNVISQTFKAVTASGKEMSATFKDTATGFDLLSAKVDNAKASLKALEAQQKATQAASRRQDANTAESQLRNLGVIKPTYNVNQINATEAAFQKVRAAIESGAVSLTRFDEILRSIKADPKAILPNMTKEEASVSRVLRNLQEGFDKTGEKAKRSAESLSISFAGIFRLFEAQVIKRATGTLESAFISGIQSSKQFSNEIALIETISQKAGLTTAEWSEGVRRLSSSFGISQLDAARAAYEAISNQVTSGRETFDYMAEAAIFARVTGSSLTDSVNLNSAAIRNFGLAQNDARRINEIFFKTIELGRVKASDLADTFGRVGSIGAEAGVKLEEIGAALATITVKGVKPNDAMTLMSNLLLKLIRPTEEMQRLFKEWGVASGTAAIQTFGFSGVLQKLDLEAQKGTNRMGELINQIRAMRGAFNLTGDAFDTYAQNLKQITTAQDEYTNAAKLTEKSLGFRANLQLNKAQTFFSKELGDPAIKAFVELTESVGGLDKVLQTLLTTAKYVAVVFGTYYYNLIRAAIGVRVTAAAVAVWNSAKELWLVITGKQIAVQAAQTAATSAQTGAQFGCTTAMAANTVATTTNTAATAANTAASGGFIAALIAKTAAMWAWVTATKVGTVLLTGWGAAMATVAPHLVMISAITAGLGFLIHHAMPTKQNVANLKLMNDEIDRLVNARYDKIKELNLSQFLMPSNVNIGSLRETVRADFQNILQYTAKLLADAERAKEYTTERVREISDVVKVSSKALNDYVANGLKRIREQVNESKSLIKNLQKDSESIGRKFQNSIFESRMKFASEGRMDMASGMIIDDQKSQLIRNQIRQLREYISQEAKKGTKESYDEVKKTFDEISKLESQLFDASTSRQRREFDERVRRGTEQPVGFEVDPMTGQMKARYEFTVRTVELEQRLKAIAQEKLSFNQKSIELEQKKIKELEKQEAIEKERARRLTQEFNKLEQLSLLNKAGEIKPEYKRNDGTVDTEKVLRQFDEITKRIKDAVGGQKALEQFAVYRDLMQFRIQLEQQMTAVTNAEVMKRVQGEMQIRERSVMNRLTEAQSKQGLGRTQFLQGAKEAEAAITKLNDIQLRGMWDNSPRMQAFNQALLETGKAVKAFRDSPSNRTFEELAEKIRIAEAVAKQLGSQLTVLGKSDELKAMLAELKKLKDARDLIAKGVDTSNAGDKMAAQIDKEMESVFISIRNVLPQALVKVQQEGQKAAEAIKVSFVDQMNIVILKIDEVARAMERIKVPPGPANPLGPQPQPQNADDLMFGGLPSYYNQGKYVSWIPRGSDTEPAMIGKREMVMTEQASMQFAPLLRAMNQGSLPMYMNKGGNVTNVGDINVTMQGGGTSTSSAKEFAKTVRRGIRRGTISPFN